MFQSSSWSADWIADRLWARRNLLTGGEPGGLWAVCHGWWLAGVTGSGGDWVFTWCWGAQMAWKEKGPGVWRGERQVWAQVRSLMALGGLCYPGWDPALHRHSSQPVPSHQPHSPSPPRSSAKPNSPQWQRGGLTWSEPCACPENTAPVTSELLGNKEMAF